MSEIVLKGRKITAGKVKGRALVSKEPICWLESVDLKGFIIEEGHDLEGQNIAGTILVYPTGKGSTSGSYKIYQMALEGSAPKAIINTRADSITVSGAILGNIPMVHNFDSDPTEIIETGDEIMLNGATGILRVKKR